ncbi:MAG: guanylate kinase [Kiritimatiellae bacterium]|nr:guanylate kinase [Kiritimatiellia bacterium]
MSEPPPPLLIVVSAPSGAGKTTICERLLAAHPQMVYSVSCTTRPPRGAEVNGRDYHFLSSEQFDELLARGEFLEHATVHGHRYGTLRAPVAAALTAGRDVLMDIDVQGAASVRRAAQTAPPGDPIARAFVDIFIVPPSLEELRRRLLRRGTDSAATIAQRLANAQMELARAGEYRHTVVNDDLERAVRDIEHILDVERARRA